MSRWIDADALKEDLLINHNTDLMSQSLVLGSGFDVGVDYVMLFIEDAPSIDLVRCAECKHLEVLNTRLLYALCRKFGVDFEPFETDTRTHGCSWGERKENE